MSKIWGSSTSSLKRTKQFSSTTTKKAESISCIKQRYRECNVLNLKRTRLELAIETSSLIGSGQYFCFQAHSSNNPQITASLILMVAWVCAKRPFLNWISLQTLEVRQFVDVRLRIRWNIGNFFGHPWSYKPGRLVKNIINPRMISLEPVCDKKGYSWRYVLLKIPVVENTLSENAMTNPDHIWNSIPATRRIDRYQA